MRQPRAPGLIDLHVGRWLRALRKAAGMSREQLATRAGLTFQQIHKYETGQNRISAGRLAELAAILNVSPGDFYLGAEVLQNVLDQGATDASAQAMLERDVCDLLIAYLQIGSEEERRRVLATVKAASGRRLNDHGETAFVSRRADGVGRPLADEAAALGSALRAGAGRDVFRLTLAGQHEASWVKPLGHVSGEIRALPHI